ncbi:MAG: FliI/YscN family ATPase, partial [Phycisphaerales bacterium]|nr:FliI/YscN family ATPase [Phycisphaerales bacterium]
DIAGEIVGFDGPRSIVMLYGAAEGICPGTRVIGEQSSPMVNVGHGLLGRVIDGLGRPIDSKPAPVLLARRLLHPDSLPAMNRRRITTPLATGVRAVDGLLTLGRGQRIGVFSGPGVGKSTLLSSVARHAASDVNIIALIGERGREVRDFIEDALGEEGLARSVVIVATGDEPPLLRVRAAHLACTVAEYFRDDDMNVMLMMDSITRFAQAQRQIGLSVGEPPATKGYTPSVFASLPILLERAGALEGGGSITGLYAVLVEGDDLNEPISDAARGVLDGHLALSRTLGGRGRFPAIDVTHSISRVADDVCDEVHCESRRLIRRLLAAYEEAWDLMQVGAYVEGSNRDVDVAKMLREDFDRFLLQAPAQSTSYPETCAALIDLARKAAELLRASKH